jgi:cellulose synthase/poly-beta-1,6-N-acetylglucosamine synthase-like glycosyltransferase
MNTTWIEILFWVAMFIVFYTYLGYGILLLILVKLKRVFGRKKEFPAKSDEELPDVTLFITAYNEEDVVDEKMENSTQLDYPKEKLHIVWVTDGTNDSTNDLLKNNWGEQAKVLFSPERRGKTAAINRAMPFIETPIVVYTDANTMLNKEAIREIVHKFDNPKVGCVAGEKRIAMKDKSGAATGGEGIYWKYESTLKRWDSELYSAVGAAGELFAVRRELFKPIANDTLLDDFIMSLQIAMQGYVIAYCAEAYATEGGSADMVEEQKRKVRISAGGLQSIIRLKSLLNPFKYGVLSFQYVSHRVLRWSVTPVLLFLLLPINIALVCLGCCPALYTTLLILQILFYLCGFYGHHLSKKQIKNKFLFVPYYFLFMNINVINGFKYLYKRRSQQGGAWEKSKRA